jgi:hypothetical protein
VTADLLPEEVNCDCVPRCRFGLCGLPAEHMIVLGGREGGPERMTLVCGLHVTPATVWGVPDDQSIPIVLALDGAGAPSR